MDHHYRAKRHIYKRSAEKQEHEENPSGRLKFFSYPVYSKILQYFVSLVLFALRFTQSLVETVVNKTVSKISVQHSTFNVRRSMFPEFNRDSRFTWICLLLLCLGSLARSAYGQTACATVKIVIEQRVTLERQAFEATLTIDNGLGLNLTNFAVDVWVKKAGEVSFLDRHPNTVETTDLEFFRESATELFFFKPIQTDPATTIEAGKTEVFNYLLIPTQEAALTEAGTNYEVGAYITYQVGGKDESIEVEPDSILVKPLPELTLEYFLPKSVIADNSNTSITEASEPFDLGVRVVNSGIGTAQDLQIESFQPKIEENDQGLLVDFRIISSEVNGAEAQPSLTVNFGELLAGHAETASWHMISTVFGRFIEAKATFTHSDELGGDVTSVIKSTSVYRLVGKVDANSDGIPDFLSIGTGSSGSEYNEEDFRLKLLDDASRPGQNGDTQNADFLNLHSSGLQGNGDIESIDKPLVANLSDYVSVDDDEINNLLKIVVGAPGGQSEINYSFVRIPDPRQGNYEIASVQREEDNAFIKRENFSLTTELAENEDGTINESAAFEHYIDIFDIGNIGGGDRTYIVNYGAPIRTNSPPVIVPLPELPLLQVGEEVSFTVEAYDLDGDPVELSVSGAALLSDADFTEDESNTNPARAVYDFTWIAEEGASVFSVVASDGQSSSSASISFNVLASVDLDAWLTQYGLSEADLEIDDERDGYNVLLEYILNLDPDEKSIKGLPQVFVQDVDGAPHIALQCDVLNQVLNPDSGISLSALMSEDSRADVASWTQMVPESNITTTESSTPGMTRIVWVDPEPISNGSGRNARFIRLQAEYTSTDFSGTAYSPALGGIELIAEGLRESFHGIPLQRTPVVIAELGEVAANSVTDTDSNFLSRRLTFVDTIGTAGQYNPDPDTGELRYFAEFASGAAAGQRLPIVGSGTNWVAVSKDPEGPFVAYFGSETTPRDLVFIRPYWTLGAVLDVSEFAASDPSDLAAMRSSDAVTLSGSEDRIFKNISDGLTDSWGEISATGTPRMNANASAALSLDNTVIEPGSVLKIRRSAESLLSYVVAGDATSLQEWILSTPASGDLLEIPFTLELSDPVSLDESGLTELFTPADFARNRRDELIVWDTITGFYTRPARRFYLLDASPNPVWREVGDDSTDQGSFSLQPGQGYLIRRRGP